MLYHRLYAAGKPEIFTIWPFTKKVQDNCNKPQTAEHSSIYSLNVFSLFQESDLGAHAAPSYCSGYTRMATTHCVSAPPQAQSCLLRAGKKR